MERIEITRVEYENTYGIVADSYCVGAILLGDGGVPLIEFVFVDEGPTVQWLERLYKL